MSYASFTSIFTVDHFTLDAAVTDKLITWVLHAVFTFHRFKIKVKYRYTLNVKSFKRYVRV